MRGKDGRLFAAGDADDTLGQHTGERLLTEHQVQQWQDLLEARSAWLSTLGIPYVFLVAPDPHAVYAEMLPEGAVPGRTRPVLQILERLAERDSWAAVLYPLNALRDARDEAPVYSQTDPCWSGFGAYVAYRELMAALTEILPVRRLPRRQLRIDQLAGRVEPIGPRARLVSDNGIRGRGRLVEYQADSYNALTCLVCGNRFAKRMVRLVAEAFQRTFWAHVAFDYELVRELQPHVVVSVAPEHSMIAVQSDSEPGIRRLEAQHGGGSRPLSQV